MDSRDRRALVAHVAQGLNERRNAMTIELLDADGQPLTVSEQLILFVIPTSASLVGQTCSISNGVQLVPLGMSLADAVTALEAGSFTDGTVPLVDGRDLVWNARTATPAFGIAGVDGNPDQCWVYGGESKFLVALSPADAALILFPAP